MSVTAPNLVAAEPAVSHAIRPFHIEIHTDPIMVSQPQAVTEVILPNAAALGAREPLGTAD
jgi:hypothetical protein